MELEAGYLQPERIRAKSQRKKIFFMIDSLRKLNEGNNSGQEPGISNLRVIQKSYKRLIV
jgi:hypothetical protein